MRLALVRSRLDGSEERVDRCWRSKRAHDAPRVFEFPTSGAGHAHKVRRSQGELSYRLDLPPPVGNVLDQDLRIKDMVLRTTFKHGAKQSYLASHYFTTVAEELVRTFIGDMEPRQYLVMPQLGESVPLRMWSKDDLMGEDRARRMEQLNALHSDVLKLSDEKVEPYEVGEMVARWLQAFDPEANFFLEHLHPGQSFHSQDAPLLSLAVLGGHVTMLSAAKVMYVRMDNELFGLAVAGSGSYLLEPDPAHVAAQQHLRRA